MLPSVRRTWVVDTSLAHEVTAFSMVVRASAERGYVCDNADRRRYEESYYMSESARS